MKPVLRLKRRAIRPVITIANMDLNRAMLIGTMVTDPVIRKAGDKSVCNFRLVTNSWGKDKQRAEYHNVVCWDKNAENVGTFLTKGSRIYLDGRLQTREWTTADGQKKTTTEIVAGDIIFLDKKDAPARSTDSVVSITRSTVGDSVTMSTLDFVNQSMDKSENIMEIDPSSIPF